MPDSTRALIDDQRGGSLFDYAILAAVFAMSVLATTSLVSHAAAGQLVSTQTLLTNAASLTPTGTVGRGGS
jgi:Flp pilus assembly pilin Flp